MSPRILSMLGAIGWSLLLGAWAQGAEPAAAPRYATIDEAIARGGVEEGTD